MFFLRGLVGGICQRDDVMLRMANEIQVQESDMAFWVLQSEGVVCSADWNFIWHWGLRWQWFQGIRRLILKHLQLVPARCHMFSTIGFWWCIQKKLTKYILSYMTMSYTYTCIIHQASRLGLPFWTLPGIEEALSDFEAKISDLVKGMLERRRWASCSHAKPPFLWMGPLVFLTPEGSKKTRSGFKKTGSPTRCIYSYFQVLEECPRPAECGLAVLQDNSREFFQRLEDLEKSFITGLTEGAAEPVLCHGHRGLCG